MYRVPEPSLPKIVRTFLRTASRSVVANARYTQSAPDAGQSAHNVRPGDDTLQTPVLYNGNPVDVLIGHEGGSSPPSASRPIDFTSLLMISETFAPKALRNRSAKRCTLSRKITLSRNWT